ncbi:MAG: ribonuclease M5 [Tissierellia bacterium]|nr:ribonuclease M5 [Tissierellia bacterium]
MIIRELIVVEGRDDIRAVSQAVEATIVATHGYGFGKKLIDQLKHAVANQGVIIFTDPDYMGNEIRKRLDKAVPGCRHAFLAKDEAYKKGNVGIENAKPEDIVKALKAARATEQATEALYSMEDMRRWGLRESPNADKRRLALSKALNIGYGNAKQWLKRINSFAISRDELENALEKLDEKE